MSTEENDEVAAYLARERAALGEDADLFASGSAPSAPTGIDAFPDLDETPSIPAPAPAPVASGIDAFPDLMEETQTTSFDVRVTGHAASDDPERAQFESAFPDIQPSEPAAPAAVPYGATPYPAQPYAAHTPSTTTHTYQSVLPAPAFASAQVSEEDSEAVKEWRAKQAEEIAARDEASKKKREETILKAEKAIDQFYDDYNASKEKNIRENKEKEAAFLAELTESISKGTSWERITDLIDLKNSQSKTLRASVPGGSDLGRMKEVLLSLRREGDKAPAAGGY